MTRLTIDPLIQDRCGTALISLGIPKLVRFDKIRLRPFFMVFSYFYRAIVGAWPPGALR
jgi:hypothetical protein